MGAGSDAIVTGATVGSGSSEPPPHAIAAIVRVAMKMRAVFSISPLSFVNFRAFARRAWVFSETAALAAVRVYMLDARRLDAADGYRSPSPTVDLRYAMMNSSKSPSSAASASDVLQPVRWSRTI